MARPGNKAIIAVARALLVISWHALAAGEPCRELGAGYFDRRAGPERETARLLARLEAPGHRVTLEAAAQPCLTPAGHGQGTPPYRQLAPAFSRRLLPRARAGGIHASAND